MVEQPSQPIALFDGSLYMSPADLLILLFETLHTSGMSIRRSLSSMCTHSVNALTLRAETSRVSSSSSSLLRAIQQVGLLILQGTRRCMLMLVPITIRASSNICFLVGGLLHKSDREIDSQIAPFGNDLLHAVTHTRGLKASICRRTDGERAQRVIVASVSVHILKSKCWSCLVLISIVCPNGVHDCVLSASCSHTIAFSAHHNSADLPSQT